MFLKYGRARGVYARANLPFNHQRDTRYEACHSVKYPNILHPRISSHEKSGTAVYKGPNVGRVIIFITSLCFY